MESIISIDKRLFPKWSNLIFFFLTAACCGQSELLFQNGDFEGESKNLLQSNQVKIVEGPALSGERMLNVNGPLLNGSVVWNDISFKRGKHYEISYWVRTAKNYSDSGKQIFKHVQTFKIVPAFENESLRIHRQYRLYQGVEWQKVTAYFYAPRNGKERLNLGIYVPQGEYFIDNIGIREFNDEMFKGNLISNGNFEHATLPHGWYLGKFWSNKKAPFPAFYLDETAGFFDGKRSLRIDCKRGDCFVLRHTFFPARNGKTYRFSFWMRADREQTITAGTISFAGTKVKNWYRNSNFKIGRPWRNYQFTIKVPDSVDIRNYNESRMALNFEITNGFVEDPPPGSVWLDNVEVYEIN